MENSEVLEFLQQNQSDVEAALETAVTHVHPRGLYDPVKYVLAGQGKRFRPQLALTASNIFSGIRETAIQIALAVELFHVFTLVHDDIMDSSGTRRGRATIHIKWDEATAILAGDFLLGKANDLVMSLPDATLRKGLERFGETVRILCEGQIRDMSFEKRKDVGTEEYLDMIDQKTSALLQTSLILGAMTGKVTDKQICELNLIGHHLGRAFQIQDDLLDLTASSESWGKPVGGDLISGKKTFLLLEAVRVEKESGGEFFSEIMAEGGMPSSRLMLARDQMLKLGVLETARSTVIFHSEAASNSITNLPMSLGRDALAMLTKKMARRVH